MASEKRTQRITIRLENELVGIAEQLVRSHKAGDMSKFVRGLIIGDAVASGLSIEADIPSWLVGRYVLVGPMRPAVPESKDAAKEQVKHAAAAKARAERKHA